MTIGIDVHGEGGISINGRPINAADIRVFVIGSAGGNPADGKHILIAGKTASLAGITVTQACLGTP